MAKGQLRRDITLTKWHDDVIANLMETRGVGRSEAIRLIVHEFARQREKLNRFALKRFVGVLRLNCAAIRLTPAKMPDALKAIELTAEELDKLADA